MFSVDFLQFRKHCNYHENRKGKCIFGNSIEWVSTIPKPNDLMLNSYYIIDFF